jgi:hypothetical protein
MWPETLDVDYTFGWMKERRARAEMLATEGNPPVPNDAHFVPDDGERRLLYRQYPEPRGGC